MLEKITFENFRGFEKLELTDIRPLTLLSGGNNSGKTSVLEGIFLFHRFSDPHSFARLNQFRGVAGSARPALWEQAFFRMDPTTPMRIKATYASDEATLSYAAERGSARAVGSELPSRTARPFLPSDVAPALEYRFTRSQYAERGCFLRRFKADVEGLAEDRAPSGATAASIEDPENRGRQLPVAIYMNASTMNEENQLEAARCLGRLQRTGAKPEAVRALRLIEPSVDDVIVEQESARVYVQFGRERLPLGLAGFGLNRAVSILLTMAANPGAIVLIDEIETGFHHSAYCPLWRAIASVAGESRCQVVAATHSYECVRAALEGVKATGRGPDFCYYRLGRKDGQRQAYRFSEELLDYATENGIEVR